MIAETLSSEKNFKVVATDGNAKNSISLCKKFNPDLILMDICTEDNSSGLTYSKIIKENYPNYYFLFSRFVHLTHFVKYIRP